MTSGAWEIATGEALWEEARDYLADWDPSVDLRLRRTIRLDPDAVADDLAISKEQLRLQLSIRVGTGPGRLPRRIISRRVHVLADDTWQQELDLTVSGKALTTVLDLATEVTLAYQPSSCGALAPRSVGDRLFSDNFRVRLEGEEPRFPIETVDLSALLGNSVARSAPWHLHWLPRDWGRDFHGAIRLYLNEKSTEVLTRLESQDALTLQAVLADVIGQICEGFVLDSEACEVIDQWEPSSVGGQAAIWLRKAWPGRDAAFIRSVLESRPGVFRSTLLALAELGD